ncbi:hypothetical protein BDV09DRAFT_189294 [Aspergillus tetrazonus]
MTHLQSIDVRYGEDPSSEPSDGIRTVDGTNADINAGFGGDFVWLVPHYSSNAANAVSNIRIIIQGDSDSAYITEVRLLRRNDEADSSVVRALGFDGASGDINKGRGGDYLYVVWKY